MNDHHNGSEANRALPWEERIPDVEKLVYQVHAGSSIGTAFAISITISGPPGTTLVTAWHVVKDVVDTDDPLEFVRHDGTLLSSLMDGPAKIYPIGPPECDTALIQILTREPLHKLDEMPAIPLETQLPRGARIGWLGFPGLVFPELCFFEGVVSGHLEEPPIYLIDGVAINGVSGGPAFDQTKLVVGLVSAYVPNQRGEGVTLPGLLIVVPLNLVRLWMQEIMDATVFMR